MDAQLLTPGPGVLHYGGIADVVRLFDDVQFTEAIILRRAVLPGPEQVAVLVVNIANVAQPVVDQAVALAVHGRPHATTAVVSHHHHMAHPQDFHGILQHRQAVHVGMDHQIGYIAVDEEFTGQQVDDLVGRYPTVGAADPEIVRRLLTGQGGEEVRILTADPLRPFLVLVKEFLESVHALSRRQPW